MTRRTTEKRPYQQTRRAEQTAETRHRIVAATVDLHAKIGPARTTLSMVAEAAGVQRHTLYAHFPDERSLYLACSGLALERDPLPDVESWRAIARPKARLTAGLGALYAWYARNAELVGSVLRDAACHPLTREIAELRLGPGMASIGKALGRDLAGQQLALLHLAMSFHTWRSLVLESHLDTDAAVEAMATMIVAKA